MRLSFHQSFIVLALSAMTLFAACTPAETTELFGEKAPQVGFMSTTKAELLLKEGGAPVGQSQAMNFYEKLTDYKNGPDTSKQKKLEVLHYPSQTAYEADRMYIMLDDVLCATVIIFNTNTSDFVSVLNNYLSRYFRIDFEYILRVTGMDVEPADLDEDHQYLLGMFQSDLYLSKSKPQEDPDSFDDWLNSMVSYSMIIRSEFPYRSGIGNYSMLTYINVDSIKELAKIYDRLGLVDFVLEQVFVDR